MIEKVNFLFCVLYRADIFRITQFLPKSDEMLHFVECLKLDVLASGDLYNNTWMIIKIEKLWESLQGIWS